MDRILVNDLARHTAPIAAEIRHAVDKVLAKGWYVLGEEGEAFEREFAEFSGAAHCVGVANGTDALELAFRALGIGAGSRVATVANAGCYATTALSLVGATPVFIDVAETDHLMDVELLAGAASAGGIDAVVVTHLFGLMHDMAAIRAVADRHGLPVIEDCAQAHGAHRNGLQVGTAGDIACFSFYPTKNLGAIGDGGAVLTGDDKLAARVRRLRQYGWDKKYHVAFAGGRNSRLDEVQAAVLRAKLPHLRRWNERRRRIAARFSESIDNPRIVCPPVREDGYVAHLYVVTCEERAALRAHLETAQIGCDIHYPIPDHLQACMQPSSGSSALPVTERLAERVLTLPCFPELTDAEVDYIIERLNTWR